MKFGKYQEKLLAKFPNEWVQTSFDYKVLKLKIQECVKPANLSNLLFVQGTDFPSKGLAQEPKKAGENFIFSIKSALPFVIESLERFYVAMNQEVEKFTTGLDVHMGELKKETEIFLSSNDPPNPKIGQILIAKLYLIDQFAFLGYKGMAKILKKADKNSGIPLQNLYHLKVLLTCTNRGNEISKEANEIRAKIESYLIKSGAISCGMDSGPEKHLVSSFGSEYENQIQSGNDARLLLSVSGSHGTDIINILIEPLVKINVTIHDFHLSRLHHNLTFSCVISMPVNGTELLRDLQKVSNEWDSTFTFEILKTGRDDSDPFTRKRLDEAPYEGRKSYIATTFSQSGMTAEFLHEWLKIILRERISIDKMNKLSSYSDNIRSIDFTLSVPPSVDTLKFKNEIFKLSSAHNVDFSLQENDVFRKSKRLIVFDMDSTLVLGEMIDEIASLVGKLDDVKKITSLAMNGGIEFKQSLEMRVSLLKGTSVSVIQDVIRGLKFTEGAEKLCRALKVLGYKIAVISGGFLPIILSIKSRLGLDYVFANQLEVSPDGKYLTGKTTGSIVDAKRKAELLQILAQAEGISLEQVIAVGDGANDLQMLNVAGLGVAFNAKPIVQEGAMARINQPSLINLLYILGYNDEEIDIICNYCSNGITLPKD